MNAERVKEYRERARLLKVLAHEVRLAVVDRLASAPATVGELAEELGLEQSALSKHLALLRAAGVVEDERKGRAVEYRLLIPCVTEFLACATQAIRERISLQGGLSPTGGKEI